MKMESTNVWFKLFASCVLVKGLNKSLIYDLERTTFYEITEAAFEFLELSRTMSLDDIKINVTDADNQTIDRFYEQFVEKELGFYTTDPQSFPEIDFSWDSPNIISNSIVEFDTSSNFQFGALIQELNTLLCKAIQIRILDSIATTKLENIILDSFNETQFVYIELFIPSDSRYSFDLLINLLMKQPRLKRIIIYGADEDKIIRNSISFIDRKILLLMKDIRTDFSEKISTERFSPNVPQFSEAQNHNLGLNKKVCIDKFGSIKNYIDHSKIYGNIHENKILDIVIKNEFQKKWFISNDNIETCRTCAYRYACVSNSDIIAENGKFFKKTLCTFYETLETQAL